MKRSMMIALVSLVALAAAPCQIAAQVGVWPVNGHGYRRGDSGGIPWNAARGAADSPEILGQKLWVFETAGAVDSSPAIGPDGTIYFGSGWGDGRVFALNGATGLMRWEFPTGGGIVSAPAIGADGTVYVSSGDSNVYALDGITGQQRWLFRTGSGISASPAIGPDGMVHVGSGNLDRQVYGLDAATGQQRWAFRTGAAVESSAAVGADGTVYVGSNDGRLYALNGVTGEKRWEFLTGGYVDSSPAVGADGTVYVGAWDRKLYALDGATGQKRWEHLTGGLRQSAPALGPDGTVFVGCTNTVGRLAVIALNGATGELRWEFEAGGEVRACAVGADGTVYVGEGYPGKRVYALDGATGQKQWEFLTGGGVYSSCPAIGSDGTVYVGSWDGSLYASSSASVGGLAPSSWPKFRADAQNTGRVHGAVGPSDGPPQFTQQPSGLRVPVGANFTLSAWAEGRLPLAYQWYQTGQPVPGAVTNGLTVTNARLDHSGDYQVTVHNSLGGATSEVAHVVVGYPLILTTNGAGRIQVQPAFAVFEPGQSVQLTAIPTGGNTFLGWEGDTAETDNPLTLTMDGPKQITARFSSVPGSLKWEFQVGPEVYSSPGIGADGTVYVNAWEQVYALDGATGQKRWGFPVGGGGVYSCPAIGADGTLYVGCRDHKVYALNGATGQKRWEFETGGTVYSSPAIAADGTVYVGSSDWRVYALDGLTGQKRWEFQASFLVYSSPAIGADGTVYVGSQDRAVYALDGETGQKRWSFVTGGAVFSSPAVGADGTVYVGSNDHKVYALNGATGQKQWEFATGSYVDSSPTIGADGTVYVGSDDNKVYALDGATGRKRWEFQTGEGVFSSPAIGADGTVYVASFDRKVYALDGATGQKRWEFQTGGFVGTSPTIGTDGTVYAVSRDGKLYALSSTSVGGLAASPWPKFHRDAQNTGRAVASWPTKVVQWTVNGHWYERVDSGQITWTGASEQATRRTHEGMPGHLVTVNSAEENRFLTEAAILGAGNGAILEQYWLGGFQPEGAAEPGEGWAWVTGEPFNFTNWEPGEPNNAGEEDGLVFWGSPNANGKPWNDMNLGYGYGYVVEYEAGYEEDLVPPTLAEVLGDVTLTRATLKFSEAVAAVTATNLANYALSGGRQVLDATLGADGATVILTTNPQTPQTVYTVTVNHVTDLAGNRIAPDSQGSFTAWDAPPPGQFTFANKNLLSTPPIEAKVFGSDCSTPLSGTDYWTQAYIKRASDPESSFMPVGAPVHFRTGANAGYIVPVVVTTPFPAGTTIAVEMRVWEAAFGDSYEAAVANGGLYGRSNPVVLTVTAPPNLPADMIGLQAWCQITPPPMPPWIVHQPSGVRVAVEKPFALSVSAINAAPWAYQWYQDGQPIFGQNESVLNVAGAQLTDAGGYHVTVTNSVGGATSQVARVVVGYPLILTTNGPGRIEVQPVFEVYEPGQSVVLRAIPSGGSAFQVWQGDLAGSANPIQLTMDGPKQVQARFGSEPTRLKWQVVLGSAVIGCPAIGMDGTLYVAAGTQVLALDGGSGGEKWSVSLEPFVTASPALVADGTVYIGSGDRHVHALEGATGARKWAYQTGNTGQSCPAIGADGTAYVGCSNLMGQATITALDGTLGTQKWEFVTASWGLWSLAVGAEGTVYAGAGTNLFALDGERGTPKWTFAGPSGMAIEPAIGLDGTIYAKSEDGRLSAIDGATGAIKWAHDFEPGQSGPVIGFDDTLFLGGGTNVSALDAATGTVKWKREAGGWVQATPAVAADNTVYVASSSGTLYALNGGTGAELWRFETGSWLGASPAIGADGTVYVGAGDGTLYALRGDSGLAPTPWAKFRCDAQNTGRSPAEPPGIERQPSLAVLKEGGQGRITVRLSGTPTPQVQWFFNGTAVPRGTNAILAFPSVARAEEGLYSVVAGNWLGQATSAPVVAVVSNVEPLRYPGWRWEGGGGVVSAQMAPSPFGPFSEFGRFPAGASSGHYVETNPLDTARFYRLRTDEEAVTRFTATTQVPGWWYPAAIGSRHRIEYVWSGSGWTNWVLLTELTLPETPYRFLDTDAFDHPAAVYRSTPVP